MNCEEALELLSGHLDGANTQEEETQLQAHLASCPACRAILEAYEAVDSGLASLQAEPPAELVSGVMEAVRQESSTAKKIRRFPTRGIAATAVAAALLLVIGTTYLPELNRNQESQATLPDTVSYAADTPVEDTSSLSKAMPADSESEESADAVPDAAFSEEPVEADDETVSTAPQTDTVTVTAQSPNTQTSGTESNDAPTADAIPNTMTVTPSMVTADTASDAVKAAFPDGTGVPELLVELLDNPDTPAAANITELAQLTAEATATEQIVFYECSAEIARQIVTSYAAVYTFETPAQLDTAADTATCGLLVIQP